MKNALIVVLFFAIMANLVQASDDKLLTKEKKFGLSWNIWGPTIFTSLSANYFATTHIKIEAGAGLFGYFGGSTYHFYRSGSSTASPYLGACIAGVGSGEKHPALYLPFGVGFGFGRNRSDGFTFSLELAYFRDLKYRDNWLDEHPIGGSLKLGCYF